MDNIIVAKVAVLLQEAVVKKEVDASSAMFLITKGMEFMETFPNMTGPQKKDLLVKVIEKVAAGTDGIIGTNDDIIPKATVEALQSLLQKDLLGQVISVIKDASRGKFNLQQSVAVAQEVQKTCLPGIMACFAVLKKKKKL